MTLCPSDLRAIVRTTCLLESRSERYADYLARALPRRFAGRVRAWSAEEAEHGRVLRSWLEVHDPTFDFEVSAARLSQLPYHPDPMEDRGPAAELLSRCVVEALASGFYRALRDATEIPSLKRICRRLMADEARHFAGFRAMAKELPVLSVAQRVAVMGRRVLELEDDQVLFASHCASHTDVYSPPVARSRYMSKVYGIYRREHLHFVQGMLLPMLGGRAPVWIRRGVGRLMYTALQGKRALVSPDWPARPVA